MNRNCGFSLVEVAVALVVTALVGGAAILAANLVVEGKGRDQAQSEVDRILARVVEYAALQHRLPCPDLEGDGHESRAPSGSCTSDAGFGWIPYQTLGLSSPATVKRGFFSVYRGEPIDLTRQTQRLPQGMAEQGVDHLLEGLRWLSIVQPQPESDEDAGTEDQEPPIEAPDGSEVSLDPAQTHMAALAGDTPDCTDILGYPAVALVLPGPQGRMEPGGGVDLSPPPRTAAVCLPPPNTPLSAQYDGVSGMLSADQLAARLKYR
ncbi:MAG: prepilin-type N-terminal cleavage/methylation domain-containing protein [Halothiobacillaceae bacterium]